MKKTYIYITGIALVAAVAFSGCQLESEDYGDIYPTVFPTTAADADALVVGSCYGVFHAGWGKVFGMDAGIHILGEYTSDIGNPGGYFWNDDIAYGRWTINNPYLMGNMDNKWSLLKNISGMTLTIDRVSAIDMDETHKNRLIAEVRCGRGLLTFLLHDLFGDLPYPDLETLKNPLVEKILPREDVRQYIEDDLKAAAAAPELPYSYKKGDANYGHFTKGVAWMVLLKLYMQNHRWDDAITAGRELMKPEYGYDLVPTYKDIFTLKNEQNAETIYSFIAEESSRGHSYHAQVVPAGYSQNGVDFPGGCNAHKLEWWFIHTFDPDDQRLDVIITEYTDASSTVHNEANATGLLVKGAVPYKYEISPETIQGGWWTNIDAIVYRYADALTLLAEAIVRKDNNVTGEAIELLNRVHTRAFPAALKAAKTYTSAQFPSPRAFLDTLLMERARELFYENGSRRQDLIRDGSYVEKFTHKCQEVGESTMIEILGEDAEHFPVPQWVIDSGKGIIEQNPGY